MHAVELKAWESVLALLTIIVLAFVAGALTGAERERQREQAEVARCQQATGVVCEVRALPVERL